MRWILRYSFILFLFSFCNQNVFSQSAISSASDKSISFSFHLQKTSSGNSEIELKDFDVINYRNKEFASMKQSYSGGLMVMLKNSSGEIISQQNIESPLNEQLEVPAMDGHIESVSIAKQAADFNIRLAYNNSAQKVEVYQLDENKNQTLLASFVLR